MLWRELTADGETNGGVSVFVQIGGLNRATGVLPYRATLLLAALSPVLAEQAFNVLRTQQQLGYVVWATAAGAGGVGRVQVDVQSAVVSPDEVQQRIDAVSQFRLIFFFCTYQIFLNKTIVSE